MESSIEEGQRPTLRVLVCLVLADKGLDLCRQQTTDRGVAFRGESSPFEAFGPRGGR
jgi:hypothetical protein